MGFHDLEHEVAPGWSLREGYARGPAAEGRYWIWGPTYEEVVWWTWCNFFGLVTLNMKFDRVFPPMPPDWHEKISRARAVWMGAVMEAVPILQNV